MRMSAILRAMLRPATVALLVLVVACNSQPSPPPAQEPSPGSTAGAPDALAKPVSQPKQFGAAFTLPASEGLSLAVARIGKDSAPPAGSGVPKVGDEHSCGAAHGAAGKDAKDASGKEVASCGAATSDDSGKLVRVSGTVSAVCQKAGCWLTLQDGTTEARIFTKEHQFFMPKDIAGKHAEVEGLLRAKTVSAAFAKHLAEDGGKDPAKVDGPQQEFMVTAMAVRLLD